MNEHFYPTTVTDLFEILEKFPEQNDFMNDKPPMEKKLCVNCKYYRKSWFEHIFFRNNMYDMCSSPNTTDDLVTGHKQRYCDMLRASRWEELDYSCGPDGRFFEPK